MSCTFNLPINGTPEAFEEKVKTAVEKAGGQLSQDNGRAVFTISTPVGRVVGNYAIEGTDAKVDVTDKPFFLSCDKIKEFLENYLK
ncbi:MAG: hypothetical protein EOP51_01045 [Sphingobacteriales bacterium]|nr:MAG: hypothetical protein EOP51_01045 [Sphingobacteriales bacterium]